jgi:hypothetical protein
MVLEDREAQRQELLELERGMPYEGAVRKGWGWERVGRASLSTACQANSCPHSTVRAVKPSALSGASTPSSRFFLPLPLHPDSATLVVNTLCGALAQMP